MKVIKTDGYNRYFDVVNFSELKTGDLFFSAGDVKYTLENGEMYLDFQIHEKQDQESPIVDCGGCLLIDDRWQEMKSDFDFDEGKESDIFDFLASTIECRLDFYGLKDALTLCKDALEILKKNLWYFE